MIDTAAQLEHLVRVGNRKGCTVWLAMVTPTLARAARRIRKLEAELRQQGLYNSSSSSSSSTSPASSPSSTGGG